MIQTGDIIESVKAVLVHLDDSTATALERVAPVAKRQRAEFIRTAIKRAVQAEEMKRMRQAYLAHPDNEPEWEDWTNWEEFR